MFGIPNPLYVASDWFSSGASDVWGKMIDAVVDRPELVVIPVLIVAGALVGTAVPTAYSTAYAITAGAKDAAEEEEFGHALTGGLF